MARRLPKRSKRTGRFIKGGGHSKRSRRNRRKSRRKSRLEALVHAARTVVAVAGR